MPKSINWTDDLVQLVTDDWQAGLTKSQIAAKHGLTPNMVMGKVRRLGLSRRETAPFWSDEEKRTLKAMRADGCSDREIGLKLGRTHTAVQAYANKFGFMPRPQIKRAASTRCSQKRQPLPPLTMPAVAPPLVTVFKPRLTGSPCCWPIGEPRTVEFRFCDADTVAGRPYCGEHLQRAYVKTAKQVAHVS